MATVNLEQGVIFGVESHEFYLEFNGKKFTAKTFDGVIKQKEQHEEMLKQRNLDRKELITVINLRNNEKFLYHPTKQHLYKENQYGYLDRVPSDQGLAHVNFYCEESKLDKAEENLLEHIILNEERDRIDKKINDNRRKLDDICVKVKNYKAK